MDANCNRVCSFACLFICLCVCAGNCWGTLRFRSTRINGAIYLCLIRRVGRTNAPHENTKIVVATNHWFKLWSMPRNWWHIQIYISVHFCVNLWLCAPKSSHVLCVYIIFAYRWSIANSYLNTVVAGTVRFSDWGSIAVWRAGICFIFSQSQTNECRCVCVSLSPIVSILPEDSENVHLV